MELFCSQCLTINHDTNLRCVNCGNHLYSNDSEELRIKRLTLAGFGVRITALGFDLLVITLVWLLFSFSLVSIFPFLTVKLEEKLLKTIFYILGIIMMLVYFTIMETSNKQGTIGKQLFKLRIADIKGNKLSIEQILLRSVSKIITCLTFGIGYLLILFTEEKQAIHDMLSNTFVFKE